MISFFSSTVFARSQLINRTTLAGDKFAVYEICTSGYKFVVVRSVDTRGVPAIGGLSTWLAITQVFDNNGKAVRSYFRKQIFWLHIGCTS